MGAVRESLTDDALKRAIVRAVAPHHLISEPACLHTLDLATMKDEDQDFTAPFRLTVGAGERRAIWFSFLDGFGVGCCLGALLPDRLHR